MISDLRYLLNLLPRRSKQLWWVSVFFAVIANIFEILAAGVFSIMVSSSLGGRKSNFGFLHSLISIKLTLNLLLLILFLAFLGKLFFQWLELALKTHIATSLFQQLYLTLSVSVKKNAKDLFTSRAQNVKYLHDIIHNIYYPATLIISEGILLGLFIPFIFIFAPKASLLIFGITILLSVPTIKYIGIRLKRVNVERAVNDHLLDSDLFDQARIKEDMGFVSHLESKVKDTIREICRLDRKIVQFGTYSRFVVEIIFIFSVVTTFMFLDNLVARESRIQFLAVLAYSFFRIVPAFSRIMSARNQIYSHSYKLKSLNIDSHSNEIIDQLLPYTIFKKSFLIASTDEHLASGFGREVRADRGDWVLIKAKTGEGKTTLLKKIAGIDQVGYTANIDGKPLPDERKWHPRIGYVSQVPYLIGSSIKEMVTGKTALSSEENDYYQKCLYISALQVLGGRLDFLTSNETLSGGQRKQIALARALYTKPQILILDEVTAGMDQLLAISILNQIRSFDSIDVVIMTTHEDHFDAYFNRAYILKRASQPNS